MKVDEVGIVDGDLKRGHGGCHGVTVTRGPAWRSMVSADGAAVPILATASTSDGVPVAVGGSTAIPSSEVANRWRGHAVGTASECRS